MDLEDASAKAKFLIRDRDAKFTDAFDAGLNDAGLEVVKSGVRMPRMNSIMERLGGSVRRECLDWLLMTGEVHFPKVLGEYERHYNQHRPHRSRDRQPPQPTVAAAKLVRVRLKREEVLNGLIN